jgi:hypothetical protein
MEGDGCMQNSTAAPLPTAEPGIHSLEAGKSQHPCSVFLSCLVLVWCWISLARLPCLMKTLRRKKCPGQILILLVTCLQAVCRCQSICPVCQKENLSGYILDSYYRLLLLTHSREFFSIAVAGRCGAPHFSARCCLQASPCWAPTTSQSILLACAPSFA